MAEFLAAVKQAIEDAIDFYFQPIGPELLSHTSLLSGINPDFFAFGNPKAKTPEAIALRKSFNTRSFNKDALEKIFNAAAELIISKGGFAQLQENFITRLGAEINTYIPFEKRTGVNPALAEFAYRVCDSMRLTMAVEAVIPPEEKHKKQSVDEVKQKVYLGAVTNLFWPEFGLANSPGRNKYDETLIEKVKLTPGKFPPSKRAAVLSGIVNDVDRVWDMFGSIMRVVIESYKGNNNYKAIIASPSVNSVLRY